MKQELIKELLEKFEKIRYVSNNIECWSAREMQIILGYAKWDNFVKVIEKAKTACKTSGVEVSDHFADTGKMVDIGSGSQRQIDDIALTRYACYLVAQNGDSSKSEIAFAQTYFAVQTRKQEFIEQRLLEAERVTAREKLSKSEKKLSGIIFERGVDEKGFAIIRSKGDEVLFGGYNTSGMKSKLKIPATIKAKDFATELTSHNVTEKDLHGERSIREEHVDNNAAVRKILIQRGIKPESLPAESDVQKIKRKLQSDEKKVLKDVKRLKGKKK